MNLTTGQLRDKGGELYFQCDSPALSNDSAQFKLTSDQTNKLGNRRFLDVLLGIRPEDISIATDPGNCDFHFKAEVILVEPLGSETILHLGFGPSTLTARVSPDSFPRMGDLVSCSWKIEKCHLFDKNSGNLIF